MRNGLRIIFEPEPRLGDDALQLRPPLGHGTPCQLLAPLDDILVIPLAELDLQQVIRNQLAVGVALLQLQKALLGTSRTLAGVVDISLVIKRVVEVPAARTDAVEMTVSQIVIAVGELDAPHADVELLAPRSAQRLVIGLAESLAGQEGFALGAIERPEREMDVVVEDGTGILGRKAHQSPLGIVAAQLDGAGGQEEVDLLGIAPLPGTQRVARSQIFVPRLAPPPQIEQLVPADDELARRTGCGCGAGETARRKSQQQKKFSHRNRNQMSRPCGAGIRVRRGKSRRNRKPPAEAAVNRVQR